MYTKTWIRLTWRHLVVMSACALTGLSAAQAAEGDVQTRFASPEQALMALKEAAQTGDTNLVNKLFGPAHREIANQDAIQGANQLQDLAQHLREFSGLTTQANQAVVIRLGNKHWPYPIPLVMTNGQWVFDTLAGKEEILNRRIGHNELSAIEVCHAYVQAQRDYASKDRDGNGVIEYAQHLRSSPGLRDGLYWETAPGEAPSPFGPLVAKAQEEGYYKTKKQKHGEGTGRQPFHGYIFRILKKQGSSAPGGKYDYIINDHMVAGFALLAYPVEWGNSGVMTFIVNQQGRVFQKDLGAKTAKLAADIQAYNPDSSWRVAE